MLIGFLAGIGRSSVDIAADLADGTTPETIRAQWRRHGIAARTKATQVPIELGRHHLGRLSDLAKARGIAPEEWLRRLAVAAIKDDLFDAVVDEAPPLPKCGRGGDRKTEAFRRSRGLD